MYVSVACACSAFRSQEGTSGRLEQKLYRDCKPPTWVLDIKTKSFGRAASTLYHKAVSPVL